jgi:hypothetical protein
MFPFKNKSKDNLTLNITITTKNVVVNKSIKDTVTIKLEDSEGRTFAFDFYKDHARTLAHGILAAVQKLDQ